MRNIRTLSMLVFTAAVSALLMYWYMQNQIVEEPPRDTATRICEDYDAENMSTLDVDLVHTMVNGYKANQLNFIKSNPSFRAPDDARSVWFDLKTLKKFLYHIENISRKTKNVNPNNLGVRIYYATYPDLKDNASRFEDIQDMTTDPEMQFYGNLHTVVLIPTIKDAEGRTLDFNPLDEGTYNTGIIGSDLYMLNNGGAIPNSNPNPQLNSTGALSASARHTGSRNHGVLSPPTTVPGMGF